MTVGFTRRDTRLRYVSEVHAQMRPDLRPLDGGKYANSGSPLPIQRRCLRNGKYILAERRANVPTKAARADAIHPHTAAGEKGPRHSIVRTGFYAYALLAKSYAPKRARPHMHRLRGNVSQKIRFKLSKRCRQCPTERCKISRRTEPRKSYTPEATFFRLAPL